MPSHPTEDLDSASVRYDNQKNGTKNETKTFDHPSNDCDKNTSFIRASHHIVRRFAHLFPTLPIDIPCAVCGCETTKQLKYLSADDVAEALQFAACHVYNLNPNVPSNCARIKRCLSHSVRVGAMVILCNNGFNMLQIQFILRFRSLAFHQYLHNTTVDSTKQHAAMNMDELLSNLPKSNDDSILLLDPNIP